MWFDGDTMVVDERSLRDDNDAVTRMNADERVLYFIRGYVWPSVWIRASATGSSVNGRQGEAEITRSGLGEVDGGRFVGRRRRHLSGVSGTALPGRLAQLQAARRITADAIDAEVRHELCR